MQTNSNTQAIIAQIVSQISGSSIESVTALIEATNKLKGCKFVSLKGYNSNASDNTEVADHVINIGFQYENMKKTDAQLLANFDLGLVVPANYIKEATGADIPAGTLKVNGHYVNPVARDAKEYASLVEANLQQALTELQAAAVASPSNRVNNDIYLNDVMIFNTNTQTLAIKGQGVSKKVVVAGDIKITKKGALTVAKELIKDVAGLRTDTYRRFIVANLNSVKISGETIEVL